MTFSLPARRTVRLRFLPLAVALAGSLAPTQLARGDPYGRITVVEENDSYGPLVDKHYTQGIEVLFLTPDLPERSLWNLPFTAVETALFQTGPRERSRRFELGLGQSIFTPGVLYRDPPDALDRPYAGWLYLAASAIQETNRSRLDVFTVQAGVVGPASLAEPIQHLWHSFIVQPQGLGWNYQLPNEGGVDLSYELKLRASLPVAEAYAFELLPEVGATVGNIFTYVEASGLLRFGRNLGVDYGQPKIRPALSGTTYFNPDHATLGRIGFYVFGGIQPRFVGRNVFLDGEGAVPSVVRRPFVVDYSFGGSFFWVRGWRLDLSLTQRDPEFVTQVDHDTFANLNLSVELQPW